MGGRNNGGAGSRRHQWWSNADIADLKDPDALARFIDNCDSLFESAESDEEGDGGCGEAGF